MAKPRKRISDDMIVDILIQLCAAAGLDGQIKPEEVAMEIYPEDWQSLLKRVRLTARQLAEANLIEILRKGEVADPNDFKGVYRLRISPHFFEEPTELSEAAA